jgi:hypothetical protein
MHPRELTQLSGRIFDAPDDFDQQAYALATEAGFVDVLGLDNWSQDNVDTLQAFRQVFAAVDSSDDDSDDDSDSTPEFVDDGTDIEGDATDVEGDGKRRKKRKKRKPTRSKVCERYVLATTNLRSLSSARRSWRSARSLRTPISSTELPEPPRLAGARAQRAERGRGLLHVAAPTQRGDEAALSARPSAGAAAAAIAHAPEQPQQGEQSAPRRQRCEDSFTGGGVSASHAL